MPMYAGDDPEGYEVIDRWDGGVGWLAHPEEGGRRASHALRGDDGAWIIDPLDAPGIEDVLADVDEVVGVAVLSNYHARDADVFAERYGVPVHVPRWLNRVTERIDAPVERCGRVLGDSDIAVRRYAPLPGWNEAVAYRHDGRTLYVPDALGTAPVFTVGDERVGVYLLCRPFPPRKSLGDLEPERILVGHGEGVFTGATTALADALEGARRRLPRACITNGRTQLRALAAALGD